MPDGGGQRTNDEGASDVGDWDAGEQHGERGRATRPAMGKGMVRHSLMSVVSEKGAEGPSGHTLLRGRTDKYEVGICFFFLFLREMNLAPVEPCSDESHGRTGPVLDHYGQYYAPTLLW